MMPYTDMAGLAGDAVAIAAVVVMLPGVAQIVRPYRIALAVIVAVALLIPFGSLPPAVYVRGVIGDLSITSLVLLLWAILCAHRNRTPVGKFNAATLRTGQGVTKNGKYALLFLVAIAACLLYPMALGMGSFDPYRLGYGDPWFLGVLLFIAVLAYFRQLWLPACAIALAVLAWTAGWYGSTNLWDYLLDPLLAVYAIGVLLRQGARILSGKHQA